MTQLTNKQPLPILTAQLAFLRELLEALEAVPVEDGLEQYTILPEDSGAVCALGALIHKRGKRRELCGAIAIGAFDLFYKSQFPASLAHLDGLVERTNDEFIGTPQERLVFMKQWTANMIQELETVVNKEKQ